MASAAVLSVVNGSQTVESAQVQPGPGPGGAPARVRAVAGARYVFSDAGDEGAPAEMSVRREGSDLQVLSEEGEALAVIEGYYDAPGPLVSAGPDGQLHAYASPADGEAGGPPADGSVSRLTLSPESLPPAGAGQDAAYWPWLAGAGVLGVLGALGAAWAESESRGGGGARG